MGRHKKNRNGKEKKSRRDDEGLPSLHLKNETKKAVLAIILFALSLFFVLSCFNIAGLAGVVTYNLFYKLFGHGAFLLPVLLVLLGIYLLRSLEFKLSPSRVIGGLIFFLSSLSIIQVIAGDTSGGVVGGFLASPLLRYFDFYASLIFLSALVLISLIITFDSHQVLGFSLWQKLFKKKEEEEEQEEKFETIKLSDASKEALREEYPTQKQIKQTKSRTKKKSSK